MPKNMRIEKVTAAKFRGASRVTTLSFDPSKRFVLLFGENGTGKSTIIDAIDLVCNQNAGTLEYRSSVSLAKHLPTIGCSARDLYAEVSSDGKTWRASLKGAKIAIQPDDNTPSAAILRRHKVLKLGEATPSERFAELKRFIDVDGIQSSEDALPKAIKEMSIVIDARTQEVSTAEANLKRAFEEDRTPDEQALDPKERAKPRLKADLKSLQATVAQLKGIVDAFAAADTLLEAKTNSQEDLDAKRAAQQAVKLKIDTAKTIDKQTGITLVDLLTKAGEFLQERPDAAECPVCLQPVTGPELAKEIQARLSQMTELKALADAWAQAEKAVLAATENTRRSYINLIDKVFEVANKVESIAPDQKGKWTLDKAEYGNLFAWTRKLGKDVIAEADRYMDLVRPLVADLETKHDILNKQAIQLSGIKRDYDTCERAKKEAERAFAVRKILEEMLKVVRRERITFTQGILDGIADECDRLYSTIHPGEKLGGVRYALDQEKKGSLHQTGQFEGHKDVAPQAYFSDSHLDTLAFCFFLAVTKRTVGGDSAVIIDDVFTSVDLNHIKRILSTLLDEAKHFSQVILATHQRRWLDLFLTQQAPTASVCIVQLRPWSLETGICGDDVRPYLDELHASLAKAPMNRREVASLSGFLIESILGEMTKYLGCSIKRNPKDKYSAWDLVTSMAKPAKTIKVEKAQAGVGTAIVVSEGPPPFQELIAALTTTLNDVRNTVGDHFNWDAAEIPDATVREFGEKTQAMCRILLCDRCGGMATKDKQTHLQCTCGNLRITRV